jgi:hypothetical protein
MNEGFANWPNLMQLWQKIFVIPTNIAIYERGFSKQEALARFPEVEYSKCFDESFIMQH